MCVAVRLMAAAVVLLNAVPSLHDGVSEHQLPLAVRLALDKVHQPAARGGAGQRELSRHEDAIILLKHVRDGIPLAQIMLVGRSKQAAKSAGRSSNSSCVTVCTSYA